MSELRLVINCRSSESAINSTLSLAAKNKPFDGIDVICLKEICCHLCSQESRETCPICPACTSEEYFKRKIYSN